ncbi:MAG: MATE family efflux transporter [Dehalococcoidales bacterium]|nr:MATE family efflux transporter [Dehalococcoidales bacterium]
MQIKNHNHNVLDTDHIGRLLMKMSVPMFFGIIVQLIYNTVDTVFIGHYVGTDGIAALSVVFPLQMLAMGVGMMVGVGGASLISRLIGGSDKSGAERALGNSLAIGIVLSIVFTVIVLPNVDYWIRMVGASEKVLPFARDYLFIIMAGTVFNVLMNALMVYTRSEGNARVSMIIMILGYGLNILLDAIFIIWLDMGMTGAALATLISQLIATIYGMSYYVTGGSYLKLHISNFAPDFRILKLIFAIGIAQFAQTIAMTISATFIIKMASTYGGDLALATFGIIQRILYFAMVPGMVIGQAMQPILGFNYGAKRFRLALRTISLAGIAATLLSIVLFIILYVFPEPIIKIFTSDQQLIKECVHVTRITFIALPLLGFFNVGQMVFPSIGKALQSFIIAVARPLAFLLPLVLILPQFWQLNGVWISFPASDTLCFLLAAALLIPQIREFQKAAAAESASSPIDH